MHMIDGQTWAYMLFYFSTNHSVRLVGHYVGSRFPLFARRRLPLHEPVYSMRAGPSAPTPATIASAHCALAPACVPIACLVPIAVHNLPAAAHGRPAGLRETKNANFWPLPTTPSQNFGV